MPADRLIVRAINGELKIFIIRYLKHAWVKCGEIRQLDRSETV